MERTGTGLCWSESLSKPNGLCRFVCLLKWFSWVTPTLNQTSWPCLGGSDPEDLCSACQLSTPVSRLRGPLSISEWLHPSAHRRQAEPAGGGPQSAAVRGLCERGVGARRDSPPPGSSGGPRGDGGSPAVQTGQRQPGQQGNTRL